MLKALAIAWMTSFTAWYLGQYELQMVYPFDDSYATPEAAGEPRLREDRWTTSDGEVLILWRAAPRGTAPMVLYLPGNTGTLADRGDRLRVLLDRGYGVTAMAYRGSSGSTGRPQEDLLTQDALALARDLAGEGDRPLVIFGESLGSAVAIKVAAAGLGDKVILEAPFTSIPELVVAQFPGENLDDLLTQHWNSRDTIAAVRQPLLILHGLDDRLVPPDHGRELIARAGSSDKRLLLLEGRGHAGPWTAEGRQAIHGFIGGE